jgi:hypothetical protein
MIRERAIVWKILSVLLLAGCGSSHKEPGNSVTVKLPLADAVARESRKNEHPAQLPRGNATLRARRPTAEPVQPDAGEISRYSSLDPSSCNMSREDGRKGVGSRRCAGPGGYALEASDSDGGHKLTIISPAGRRGEFDLSRLASRPSLGTTAEWRGDPTRQPYAMIVRIAGQGEASGPNISSLVIFRLGGHMCIVAVVPRGPGQNQKARALADRKRLKCANG